MMGHDNLQQKSIGANESTVATILQPQKAKDVAGVGLDGSAMATVARPASSPVLQGD
jgi:hypothetical protein